MYIELGPERQGHAFLPGNLKQAAFSRGIIRRNLVSAGEGGDGARIVVALGIDVGPGKLIVVALLVFRRIAQRGQNLLRLAVVTLSNVGVSQSDGDRVIGGSQVFGFGKITPGKIEIVGGEKDIGGFNKIVRGDG